MNETEKQELSKAVADKHSLSAWSLGIGKAFGDDGKLWLHDDSARCFDLMVEHGLDTDSYSEFVRIFTNISNFVDITEYYTDHTTNYTDHTTKQEATRIAILRALLAKD